MCVSGNAAGPFGHHTHLSLVLHLVVRERIASMITQCSVLLRPRCLRLKKTHTHKPPMLSQEKRRSNLFLFLLFCRGEEGEGNLPFPSQKKHPLLPLSLLPPPPRFPSGHRQIFSILSLSAAFLRQARKKKKKRRRERSKFSSFRSTSGGGR